MKKLINIKIDGIDVETRAGQTILEAAKSVGIKIPSLCHLHIKEIGYKNNCSSCRICVVEVKGRKNLAAACSTPVAEGMEITTNSLRVIKERKTILKLMLSDHPSDCLLCEKSGKCDLQRLAIEFGIREIRFKGKKTNNRVEYSPSIIRDADKCILCKRCETMCREIQTYSVLSSINRGFNASMATAFEQNLETTICTNCGQCVAVCPVGALHETDYTKQLFDDLSNKEKKVIVQVAPAVRVAIGEEFGFAPGEDLTGKLVTALKMVGFSHVFDTNFAADLTIMEEGSEFKERLEKYLAGEPVKLPLITSCCPAWVKFAEHHFHNFLGNLSTAKSPQQMFGAVAKNIWAKENGISKEKIICVSIMPCLAKKYEASRHKFKDGGIPDVDYSISTRQIASLLKQANIDLRTLPESKFDNPLGYSTGAADIFGKTGGVIEAATRTLYELVTGEELEKVDFEQFRGIEGIRIAEIPVNGIKLRIGVVNGLGAARELLNKIEKGEETLHAIEVMACKGGCVGGGGQPFHYGNFEIVKERIKGLEKIDSGKIIRKSHDNPYIIELYKKYLKEPLSHEAHQLLHTYYSPKKRI